MSYNGIKVAHIVATDLKGCIGKDGKMPWHISEDLKRFKELTTGGVVIMGRKTFDSLDCKSLPNRMNIVIGSTMSFDDYYRDNKELLYSESVNDALMTARYYAKKKQLDTVWIIGGAEIYAQTMQYADEVLATTVQTRIHGGDAFYDVPPPPFRLVELSNTMTDEKSGLNYRYSKHVRFLSKGKTMNNLPLQPLKWFDCKDGTGADTVTVICEYDIYKYGDERIRHEEEITSGEHSLDSWVVAYYNRHTEAPTKEATGFATIDEAKAWAWNHYNEKMQPYVVPDSITDIANWFKAAKPEPSFNDYITQLGCHFEEVCEMMAAIGGGEENVCIDLSEKADFIKKLHVPDEYIDTQKAFIDEIELLDALCDQIVTATGVAYMMGFDIEGALKEVIRSNNSKMVNGKFEFDANGKIAKPDSYSKPDLTSFISTMQNLHKGE